MSTGAIIGIVIAVIVVVAVVVVASAGMRRARLRRQFGPEYDRLVEKHGSKRKAEAELAERERRVRALNIRDLSPEQQASYSGDWAAVQERFVDTPAEAVGAAHVLIGNVMRDRGYPVDDRTATMDALSVHHSRTMEGYRATMDLRTDSASTEQLREAMIHYRGLFEDLTGLREGPGSRPGTASRRSATAPTTVTPSPPTERAPRTPPSPSPPNPSPRDASPANPLPGNPLPRTPRSRTGAVRDDERARRTPAGPRTRPGRHAHTFSHSRERDCYDPGPVRPGEGIRLRRTRRCRPRDETDEARTDESKPMTRFQKVASALRGGLRPGRNRAERADREPGDRPARRTTSGRTAADVPGRTRASPAQPAVGNRKDEAAMAGTPISQEPAPPSATTGTTPMRRPGTRTTRSR